MKALFISYDQAHQEKVIDLLGRNLQRGFTMWEQTQGRGTKTGEPHFGSHAWPGLNGSIMAFCEDDRVAPILKALKALDADKPMLGLRAFVMPVEEAL
jgi:hypothetical protein